MPPDQPHPDALPIRLAIATEEDVVYRGLASVVTDIDNLELLGRSPALAVDPGIDVALYDVATLSHSEGTDLDWLVKETDAAVVATARDLRPDLAARALDRGVDGVVSLSAGAKELRTVIVAAATGNLRGEAAADDLDYTGGTAELGKAEGLSTREVQVVGMITMGFSNDQIAQELFLSINSVKTYIRSAYRKMGVTTRGQAITWAVQHGFALEERRTPGHG
ncbi:MAG: response regulator transcription factor [Nocardioides sp.]|nr:response regulator transcription factor [Nocardioides sp.]